MQDVWCGLVVWGVVLLLVAGCDATGTNTADDEQYVVEAYLIAGEALPPVRLTRTAPVNQPYRYDELAVEGAEVIVEQLDEDGQPAARYEYREMQDTTGVYVPRGDGRVIPLRTYRLAVTVPETDARITATTTVPDTFSIVQANARQVIYQGPTQLALTLTPSRYPDRSQGFYIFSTEALEPEQSNLTPLLREVVEDSDDLSVDDLRVTSSPVINEESYVENSDGTITVRLPWFAIAFYGPNRTTTNAIDDNLYDFVRTQSAQQGGAGFTPGTIPNIIEHIDGGTGVFGSLARQSYEVIVERPADGGSVPDGALRVFPKMKNSGRNKRLNVLREKCILTRGGSEGLLHAAILSITPPSP